MKKVNLFVAFILKLHIPSIEVEKMTEVKRRKLAPTKEIKSAEERKTLVRVSLEQCHWQKYENPHVGPYRTHPHRPWRTVRLSNQLGVVGPVGRFDGQSHYSMDQEEVDRDHWRWGADTGRVCFDSVKIKDKAWVHSTGNQSRFGSVPLGKFFFNIFVQRMKRTCLSWSCGAYLSTRQRPEKRALRNN